MQDSYTQQHHPFGIMDWFDYKKEQKIKQESTKDIIKKVEDDKLEVKKVDKIEFIGVDLDPRDSMTLGERLKGFHIEHWLTKQKISNVESLDEILISTYKSLTNEEISQVSEIKLDDLKLRFDYTLKIQELTGYIIPDYILTKSFNGVILQKFFINEVFSGKIFKKDAESLSHKELQQMDFKSDNIYIHTPVSNTSAKKKYKSLLKRAKKDQELKSEKLIEEARA
ncbi:unnamed protein product [Wickerhamomyces anomalus]